VSRVSQNNVESHPFQSRQELPFGSFRIELVEVIAALLVVDRSVAQNVKRDDEQLMRCGDNGFLLAPASGTGSLHRILGVASKAKEACGECQKRKDQS
jgi:hypothetical protein